MISMIPSANILRVSFLTAAVVIATANSLLASSRDTSTLQQLASHNQSSDPDFGLSMNVTATDAEAVVENCGTSFVDVQIRVAQARYIAMKAATDAHLGVNSPHGFRAMFKTNDAIRGVANILQNIFDLRAKGGLSPHPGSFLEPRFACVTEDVAEKYRHLHLSYDPWQLCLTRTRAQESPTAFYAAGTAYIFLCPVYQSKMSWPSISHCPSVNIEAANRFVGSQNLFSRRYQVYALIYELVRFYLGEHALNGSTNPQELFDWNNCVFNLNPLDSFRNPTNMELYVALVHQQCTQAPYPQSDPANQSPSNSTAPSSAPNQTPAPNNDNPLLPPPRPQRPGTTISTSRRTLATNAAATSAYVPPDLIASSEHFFTSTTAATAVS